MAEQSTIAVYLLDGTNRKFVVPYEYLARRFVTVTLLGTDRKPLVLGTDFRFISANQIETTQAWGDTQGYANIEVRRETSATQRLVDFYDGSVLRSRDLNVSAIQTIHIAEEARNMAGETLAENLEGNLDARFRKMVNLGQGTEEFDAVTLGQVQEWSASALNQANRSESEADRSQGQATLATQRAAAALASQNAAKVSETNSKTSETNSKTSENAAAASQSAAKTSETNSKTSETAANAARDRAEAAKAAIESTEITSLANAQSALESKNAAAASQSAAKTSETNSKTSETNSKASEVLSQKWADNPVDVPVVDGKFSAKHWAKKAEDFVGGESFLQVQNNLSDLSDVNIALENLGLTPAMVRNLSTPVGMCYTQYPGTAAPASLFGGTWKQMFNTEGVFFRTEGGGASGFEGGVQGDDNKSHTHTASTNSTGAHTHTISGTAASAGAHTHSYLTFANGKSAGFSESSKRGGNTNTGSSGAHTHSISGTAASAGAHAHTVTVAASGGSETRPKNRTIRVWQRTA